MNKCLLLPNTFQLKLSVSGFSSFFLNSQVSLTDHLAQIKEHNDLAQDLHISCCILVNLHKTHPGPDAIIHLQEQNLKLNELWQLTPVQMDGM